MLVVMVWRMVVVDDDDSDGGVDDDDSDGHGNKMGLVICGEW